MPANASWQGLYQGPYHIVLSIRTQGSRAAGTWRAVGGRMGEFWGTVSGNLLVLDYTEHGQSKSDVTTGRGYFVYTGKPGGVHEVYGEWGLGKTGARNSWWAIKRSNKPLPPGKAGAMIDSDTIEDDRGATPGCDVGCDTIDMEEQ
jgi:hypothetical protein